jgi:hypothetical protein
MLSSNAMKNPILALILAIVFGGTAAAQSSFVDLSKPMTGKTQFVVDADGKPIEFGVPLSERIERPVQTSSPAAPRWAGARAKQDDRAAQRVPLSTDDDDDDDDHPVRDRSKKVTIKIDARKIAPLVQTLARSATQGSAPTRSAPASRGRR